MNLIPTDHYPPSDDPGLSLIPFTTHPREPKGEEAYLADLFSNDNLRLGLGGTGIGDDIRVVSVPQVPQGTVPRNTKPVLHPVNDSSRPHVWPGAIPQVIPQTPNMNAHPPFNDHSAAAVPQPPTFGAFDSAHAAAVFPHSSSSHLGISSSAAFGGGAPQDHVWQGAITQIRHEAKASGPNAHPQPNVHPAVAHQLTFDTFDGAFSHSRQPSASLPATSSSAVGRAGVEQAASLSSIQNIPFPMSSRPAPAWPSSHPVVPISGLPISASVPILGPLDASAVAIGSAAAVSPAAITANFAHAEPGQSQPEAPAYHGWCPECMRPLVRVDNTVEWVRPDVMKVVLYLNFSSNAEAEAQPSWQRRGA